MFFLGKGGRYLEMPEIRTKLKKEYVLKKKAVVLLLGEKKSFEYLFIDIAI